jgi:hypothetical protein
MSRNLLAHTLEGWEIQDQRASSGKGLVAVLSHDRRHHIVEEVREREREQEGMNPLDNEPTSEISTLVHSRGKTLEEPTP